MLGNQEVGGISATISKSSSHSSKNILILLGNVWSCLQLIINHLRVWLTVASAETAYQSVQLTTYRRLSPVNPVQSTDCRLTTDLEV